MAGLLDRAQKARERAASLDGADGVTREDRARILADIEALFLAKRALPPRPKTARKRGLLLPIAVNAAAALLLALGLFLFPPGRSSGYAGARRGGAIGLRVEESLIGRLREESRLALSERERRIAEIRAELERLRLAPRPAAAAGGAAAATRAASAQAAAAQEAAEAARLELERSLEAELAALETESSRRLAALEKERAEAAFLLGQLRGVYAEARRLAASGDRDAARARAAAAGTLLDRIGAAGPGGPELAALLREAYAAVEEALLATARAEAQAAAQAEARTADSPTTDSPAAASAGADGARAEELSRAREAREAAEAKAALAAAAAEKAQARVLELERSLAATRLGLEGELGAAKEELGGARAELGGAKAALAAANEAAAAANEELAAARGELESVRDGLAGARRELEASRLALAESEAGKAERWERSERLATKLFAELASARALPAPAEAPGEEDIISLLEAKLRLRELAGAQARERGDPAIYDDFDRSLERIALEERRAGEAEAYARASAALAGLEASLGLQAAAAPPEDYLARLDRLLAALVERLR